MFVFVKFWDSTKLDFFGLATQGECESWMKIKKLYPGDSNYFCERLLLDTHELRTKELCE